MRRLLAPIVLAAALVGAAAPSASAEEACYGAEGIAKACSEGALVSTGESPVGTCLYTGGSTCTPYYVNAPSASSGGGQITQACVLRYCVPNEELSEFARDAYCAVNREAHFC